ncbi:MAG: membrane-bound lytic murein transglycosylase MltF [Nitrosomonadaceae bacterium]|nr:membrane-bound lytic murein transglycosylase MltF [Nitrosomonadaceae bacterium]|tara:strand:+ start:1008 stop:2417 length:1410 start_codon:yes stop_codon:yes gene_type:complete
MRTFCSCLSFIALILLISACDVFEFSVPSLDNSISGPIPLIDKSHELVVIIKNDRYKYKKSYDGEYMGFERDVATEFAKELGKKIRFVMARSSSESLLLLENNQAHLATGINVSTSNKLQIRFGPVYQHTYQQVAYNTNYLEHKNFYEMIGKNIVIEKEGMYGEILNNTRLKFPQLNWVERDESIEDLLSKVAAGKIDYVLSDSTQINIARNFYANLGVAMTIKNKIGKAWAFSSLAELELQEKAQKFFKRIKKDGTLNRLIDKYYGHIKRLGQENVSKFLEKRKVSLPSLRKYFYQAEEITKIDWRLIAALSYQESHWDRKATSFTNVRGIMMLTQETAERMKVKDRLNAQQNIIAGARYLLILKNTLPARIMEPDRTWIALASYNQGYGHIEDARILAQRLGLSPDIWIDLKKSLPLLSKKKHFRRLKYGYARGGEAVYLTESVRAYYDILMEYESPYKNTPYHKEN